jgi:hypothetical protein
MRIYSASPTLLSIEQAAFAIPLRKLRRAEETARSTAAPVALLPRSAHAIEINRFYLTISVSKQFSRLFV